jgi:hypothetical protein
MLRRFVFVISFVAIAGAAAAQPRKPAPPATTPAPEAPGAQREDPRSPSSETARRLRGKDVNVQVEITISDHIGTDPAQKKVVSLLAADQSVGRIRANANANRANVGTVGTILNVDVRPFILENDRILLELTVVYTPLRDSPVAQTPTNLEETLNVILQNGKSLMISQAADPVTDRRMTVDVKATIIR